MLDRLAAALDAAAKTLIVQYIFLKAPDSRWTASLDYKAHWQLSASTSL